MSFIGLFLLTLLCRPAPDQCRAIQDRLGSHLPTSHDSPRTAAGIGPNGGNHRAKGPASQGRLQVDDTARVGPASGGSPDAPLHGSAHVTTSETRAHIDLIPTAEGGRLRWLIPVTGQELTGPVIDDLLLSVFADDAAATQRLASCYTANERNGGNEG